MKRYFVPIHPSQISVDQWQRYHAAADEIEKAAIATGKKVDEVRYFTAETIDNITEAFESSWNKDVTDFKRTFKIRTSLFRSIEFGFIPDMNNLSYYEHCELNVISKQLVSGNYEYLLSFAACCFRPITKKIAGKYLIRPYGDADVEDYKHLLKVVTMDRIKMALVFFCSISAELLSDGQESLMKAMKESSTIPENQTE